MREKIKRELYEQGIREEGEGGSCKEEMRNERPINDMMRKTKLGVIELLVCTHVSRAAFSSLFFF